MNAHHDWRLVAPTYAMPGRRSPRGTSPVLQKYDTSDLVNLFLKNPQTRNPLTAPDAPALPFDVEDQVHVVRRAPRSERLKFFNLEYAPTETRKLFLDTHKRFYLVVCELHCDVFGFPNASRAGVCETGFVIRRHHWTFSRRDVRDQFLALKRDSVFDIHGINAEAMRMKGRHELQRWVPTPGEDGFGEWKRAAEEPEVLDEAVHTLQPLIPDPRKTDHAAAGRTVYFGLVPTANTNIDSLGTPQLDDESIYEIRCFVRRHKDGCPKNPTRGDCKGPLVWSAPTERYQIAAPFDLIGTSYRTINVKMPDLRALKAQAAIPRIGLRSPVRLQLPARSGVELGGPTLPIPGGPTLMGGMCFRNIPLTTIVAMFAYNILKPIVMSIFQLYYLAPLEFCLPTGALKLPDLKAPSTKLPSPPRDLKIDPEDPDSPTVPGEDVEQAIADMADDLESVGSLEGLKTARDAEAVS